MSRALTVPMIERLKADPTKRLEVSDALLPALRVVVQPGGAKSYAVRFRYRGKTKKFTIGAVGSCTLAEARDRARQALTEVTQGIDPMALRRAAREVEDHRDGLVETALESSSNDTWRS